MKEQTKGHKLPPSNSHRKETTPRTRAITAYRENAARVQEDYKHWNELNDAFVEAKKTLKGAGIISEKLEPLVRTLRYFSELSQSEESCQLLIYELEETAGNTLELLKNGAPAEQVAAAIPSLPRIAETFGDIDAEILAARPQATFGTVDPQRSLEDPFEGYEVKRQEMLALAAQAQGTYFLLDSTMKPPQSYPEAMSHEKAEECGKKHKETLDALAKLRETPFHIANYIGFSFGSPIAMQALKAGLNKDHDLARHSFVLHLDSPGIGPFEEKELRSLDQSITHIEVRPFDSFQGLTRAQQPTWVIEASRKAPTRPLIPAGYGAIVQLAAASQDAIWREQEAAKEFAASPSADGHTSSPERVKKQVEYELARQHARSFFEGTPENEFLVAHLRNQAKLLQEKSPHTNARKGARDPLLASLRASTTQLIRDIYKKYPRPGRARSAIRILSVLGEVAGGRVAAVVRNEKNSTTIPPTRILAKAVGSAVGSYVTKIFGLNRSTSPHR